MPEAESKGRFWRISTAGIFFQGGVAALDTGTIVASLVHRLTGSALAPLEVLVPHPRRAGRRTAQG